MRKRKIALLSNITVDLVKQKLDLKYEVYIPEGYDTWIQETLNPDSRIYTDEFDAVIVLLDGTVAEAWSDYSVAEENLRTWEHGIFALTEQISNIPIFVSTIDFRINRIRALSERQYRFSLQDEWYQYVQEIVEKSTNVYIFDLADAISDIGRRQFYSNKMWYMSNMPYSREGLLSVCKTITQLLESAFEPRKKIIALDLDNTLWGGVIGEDGIDGIELCDHKEGQRFYDFQRRLKEMQIRGTLLAVVSKNNPDEADIALNNHPYMLLSEDDFVSKKINWDNKAENLKEMESELNLTEGSFVFIDDNPAEREMVKGGCPEMLVPESPSDTTELKAFAEEIYYNHFLPLRVLEEDKNKTQMYQAEEMRRQDFNESLSLDEYLINLEMVADIHKMRTDEIDRVVQLCNKTNQFNLTTKRYTREEIVDIANCPNNEIYVAYLEDKYGKNGLVSVVVLLGSNKEKTIDTFLMSCRVMGRKLEDVIISNLVESECRKGCVERFIGEYISTTKNIPVENLYEKLGFSKLMEQDGHKIYELNLDNIPSKEFPFYKEIRFEETI